MKKFLSFLLCVCLITSLAFIPESISASDNDRNIGFIYNFSSSTQVSKATPTSDNTKLSFDSSMGVMKVTPKDYTTSGSLEFIVLPKSSSVLYYPILALRVYVKSSTIEYDQTHINGTGISSGETEEQSWKNCAVLGGEYGVYNCWQTLIFDTTDTYDGTWRGNTFFDDWYSALFVLAKAGTVSQGDEIYVQWAGAFSDIESANEYAYKNSIVSPKMLYDFSKYSNVSKAIAAFSNTNLSYDTNESALKVSPKNPSEENPMQFVVEPYKIGKIPVNEYPIIAMRIKVNDSNINYWGTFFESDALIGGKTKYSWWCCSKLDNEYNGGTVWQTVIVDTSNYYNEVSWPNRSFGGNWYSLAFKLAENGSVSQNSSAYVKWVGLFRNKIEVQEYENMLAAQNTYEEINCKLRAREDNGNVYVTLSSQQNISGISGSIGFDSSRLEYIGTSDNAVKSSYKENGKVTFDVFGNKFTDKSGDFAEFCFRITDYSGQKLFFTLGSNTVAYSINGNANKAVIEGCFTKKSSGDVNLDGTVNLLDIVRFKNSLVNKKPASFINANCNSDNYVNSSDLAVLRKMLLSVACVKDTVTDLNAVLSAKQEAERINNKTEKNSPLVKLASECVTVMDFDQNSAFNHHPQMTFFKGKIYCTWSNGETNEDDEGQRIMIASSSDFFHFSEPKLLVETTRKTSHQRYLNNGFIYSDGDYMYVTFREYEYSNDCYINGVLDYTKKNKTFSWAQDYTIKSSDGINWTSKSGGSNYFATENKSSQSSNESPFLSASGRFVSASSSNIIYSDAPNGYNWLRSGLSTEQKNDALARGVGLFSESSVYQTDDNVLHLMMRSETNILWHTCSYDNGNTWCDAYPTNFSSAKSMPYFGVLPDGRYFFVGSPVYDNRFPLCLYISNDGYNFNQKYIIGDENYTQQKDGYAKGGAYAYSEVMLKDGYMYIFYSKAKEKMELMRIKISDIPYCY